MTTSLTRVTVSVAELDRALPLYEGVLGLTRRYAMPDIVMLADSSGVEVLLHERPPTPGDAGVAATFRVDDVDATAESALRAGASIIDPPTDQTWGERQAVLRDADRHVLSGGGDRELSAAADIAGAVQRSRRPHWPR